MPGMASDLTLHNSHAQKLPLPIAQLYRQAHNALDPEEKHRYAFELWDWGLRLIGAAAVIEYQARGADGAKVGDLLARIDRLTLGDWWRLVRALLEQLKDDDGFQKLHEALLDKPQRGMARAAALHVEVIKSLGGQAGPRTVVAFNELFDRLITYRNRKIGHANELRSSDEFAHMAPFLLGGAIDFFERIDVLAGRKLVFIADVRQDLGRWRIVRVPLMGVAAGASETHFRPIESMDRLPRAGETYLENPDGELRALGSLGSYDPIEQTFSFKPAAPPTPSECVIPTKLDPQAADGPKQCSFDDFQLMTRLGAGGAGAVFRARQQSVDRDIALKCVLRPDAAAEQRFLREVAALGRVSHPNLARIYAYGAAGVQCYYAMELVEGADLSRIMQHLIRGADGEVGAHEWTHAVTTACEHARAAETKLDSTDDAGAPSAPEAPPTPPPDLRAGPDYIRRVVELIAQVADAAHSLHEAQPQGIIHRDIKPSNIIVSPDGERAVLVDLGLALLPDDAADRAKLTHTRQFVGTARYAPPEQIFDAHRVDRRADVYGLGATLWEMLALRPLFGGAGDDPTFDRAMAEAGSTRSHNPKVPIDLDAIVRKCLASDRTRRYSSAADFAADLRRWLAGEPVTAQPPTLRYIWSLHVRKHKARLVAAIVALVAVVVGTVASFYFVDQQRQKAVDAQASLQDALDREQAMNDKLAAKTEALEQYSDILSKIFTSGPAKGEDSLSQTVRLVVKAVKSSADQGHMDKALGLAEYFLTKTNEAYIAQLTPLLKALADQNPNNAQLLTCLGAMHALREEWPDAERRLEEAVKADSRYARAFKWRGYMRSERKQFDQALTDYTEAIRLEPADASLRNYRGIAYEVGKQDFAHAIEDYSEAVRLDPSQATYWANRGLIHQKNKDYDKALADVTEAIQRDPQNAWRYNSRGHVYYYKADYAQAAADYGTAIRLRPSEAVFWTNRADSFRYKQEYFRAIDDYTEAIRLEPKNPTHLISRGNLYHSDLRDYPKAIADYTAAIQLKPDTDFYYANRGNSRRLARDYPAAIADYNEAIRLKPADASFRSGRAMTFVGAGKFDDAIADSTEAIRLEPQNPVHFCDRGNAYDKKNDLANAIKDYTEAIRLKPAEPLYWTNRASTYSNMKEYDKSIADYTEAIRLEPKNPLHRNNRGVVYDDKHDYASAIADYTEAIKLRPDFVLYRTNRGAALRANREFDKAIEDYSAAISLAPGNPVHWNSRGRIFHYDKGDFTRAISDFTEAIRLKPEPVSFGNRARAYRGAREYDKAIADFGEAIRLSPTEDAAYANDRANVYLDKNDLVNATAGYDKAIQLAPDDPLYWGNRAFVHERNKAFDKAVADLSEAIRLSPTNANLRSRRGLLYQSEKQDLAKAIADFDEAIKSEPVNAACWAARANALRLNRQYDRALADFNNSINLEGTNALVIYRRGLTYVAMKKPDLALADFNESLRLDPKGDNCLNERGNIFMNEKRDFKRAIDDYSKAIMLNPGYAEFWTNRARAKRAAGLYDAALADHGEAIRIDPTNAVRWNSRGVLYESNQRDFPRAIADYSEAIKLKPAESLYRLNRGNAYRLNRDYAQAIADYNDSIRLDAKEPLSFNGRGLAQERIGNRKAAIADFGEAIRLDPSEPIYWSNRARAYRNGQDHALAKLDYLEAIRLSPLDAQALNNCAWHLATCLDPSVRDGALALQLAMRACELTAGADWSKLDTAAAAFAECGDFDRAILWSKAALAAARTDADRSEVKSSLVLYEIGQPARVP